MLFQIALVAFAIFASFRTWKQYQARHTSKYWFLVFGLFWTVVAVVAVTPQTTDIVAGYVGVGRGADMLVYIGVVVLFYVVYRLMIRQQELSNEITELVRKLAIQKATTPSNSPLRAQNVPTPSLLSPLSKGEKLAE